MSITKQFKLAERIQKLVDLGESGTDILHGELKNMIYEVDVQLSPLQEASNELGSDEEYEDTVNRLILTGYEDALIDVQTLIIELTYALEERNKK